MKIDYLQINSRFKNLDQVRIEFDENELVTVVVGLNGSGKSNVLEALVSIFRNLDLGESPPFAYQIQYNLGEGKSERKVRVNADPRLGETPSKQYRILYSEDVSKDLFDESNWHDISLNKVIRDKEGISLFLPRHVFAYYSGPSDRLETYFKKHRTDFYRRLLNDQLRLEGEIRPLFYAKPIHSQFVLLAFFLGAKDNLELTFLRDQLGIEDFDSAHFVFRQPDWTKSSNKKELFWGARGVVRKFIERVFTMSIAPLRIVRNENVSLTGSNIKNEFLHLFVPDLISLQEVAGNLGADAFFKMLESTLLSEILSEVRVRVKVKNINDALSFRELSEGEQQLLTVLGLLKFTGGNDSLFLLDEPDTHLNPAWSVKYLGFLREFVPNKKSSHVIMITHSPLAISELRKEQVQVMWREENTDQIKADQPGEDPQGMGFEGVLMSDMFGLKSPLDAATQQLLDEKLFLLAKDRLSDKEASKLAEIDERLNSLSMNYSSKDPLYSLFLKKLSQRSKLVYQPKQIALNPKQRKELDDITQSVIEEIKSQGQEGS